MLNAGQPTAGRGFELIVIAAVLLGGTSLFGGRGTLIGTVLAVLILKVIDNGIKICMVVTPKFPRPAFSPREVP